MSVGTSVASLRSKSPTFRVSPLVSFQQMGSIRGATAWRRCERKRQSFRTSGEGVCRPKIRMRGTKAISSIFDLFPLRILKGFAACLPVGEVIEAADPGLRQLPVRDLPQRRHDTLRPRQLKSLPQLGHPLVALPVAESGLTRRDNLRLVPWRSVPTIFGPIRTPLGLSPVAQAREGPLSVDARSTTSRITPCRVPTWVSVLTVAAGRLRGWWRCGLRLTRGSRSGGPAGVRGC